jgi:hypothetical protein
VDPTVVFMIARSSLCPMSSVPEIANPRPTDPAPKRGAKRRIMLDDGAIRGACGLVSMPTLLPLDEDI